MLNPTTENVFTEILRKLVNLARSYVKNKMGCFSAMSNFISMHYSCGPILYAVFE